MTRRSQSSGNDSSRLKPPADGSASSRRWMVIASSPVLSARRLAARPVGAHSATSTDFARRIRSSELTRVVFPTPGPPVTTSTFAPSATRIASFWLSASVSRVRCSTQGIAFSVSIGGQGGMAAASAARRAAMSHSAS